MVTFPLTKIGQEISFEACMGRPGLGDQIIPLRDQDEKELQKIGRIFEENKRFFYEPSLHAIPKKIHFVWVGPEKIGEWCLQNMRSWRRLHPDWEILLWSDRQKETAPDIGAQLHLVSELEGQPLYSYISRSDNFGEIADLIRYSFLFRDGGVYADLDAECFHAFDDIADHLEFVTGLERSHLHRSIDSSIITSNSIIASRPGHPILRETIQRIQAVWDSVQSKFPGTDRSDVFNRVIQRTFDTFAFCAKKYCGGEGRRDLILPALCLQANGLFSEEVLQQRINQGLVYAIHRSCPSGKVETDGGSWLPKHSAL